MSVHESQSCEVEQLVAADGEDDVLKVDIASVPALVEQTSVLRVLGSELLRVQTTSASEGILLPLLLLLLVSLLLAGHFLVLSPLVDVLCWATGGGWS